MNVDSVLEPFRIVVVRLNLQPNKVFGLDNRDCFAVEINALGAREHAVADRSSCVLEIDTNLSIGIAAEFLTFDDDPCIACVHDIANLRNHAFRNQEIDVCRAARKTAWPESKPADQSEFDGMIIQNCGQFQQQVANG